jgi:hypothetical protein
VLTNVVSHVVDDTLHILVCRLIENLLSAPLGTQHPGCSQESQMVADKRLRQTVLRRDVRDAHRCAETRGEYLQAAWVTHEILGR